MNYKETLSFLYDRLPMYSKVGSAAYKKDLANIIALCDAIGHPQHSFKCIHIAGTNGKGSTSHMLAAILEKAGYKTGLYTSPHIKDFRERIRVDGNVISEDFVTSFVSSIQQIITTIEPSFFEVTVAMAFAWFKDQKVDIAVIETGLGGRLDSTNIITPLLSVITSIGYDHTDILGDTLEKIAEEKAGIIKPHVPVVVGEVNDDLRSVFVNKSDSSGTQCFFSTDEFQVEYIESTDALLICHIKDLGTSVVEKLHLDLTGLYQVANARTVLCSVKQLRQHFEIPKEAIHHALSHVKELTGIYGRWEIISSKPTIVLDVAHNRDGIIQIVNQLQNNHPDKQYHFVLGFVKEKNKNDLFSVFPTGSLFYFTNAHIPRALPYDQLKAIAASQGVEGNGYDDVNYAVSAAKAAASPDDIIVVCGSFFIISEVV